MYATLIALGAVFMGIAGVALLGMPVYVLGSFILCGLAIGLLVDDFYTQGAVAAQ